MSRREQPFRPGEARRQLALLRRDVAVMLHDSGRGLLTCWVEPRLWAVVSHRLERAAFLLCGPAWPVVEPLVKVLIAPIRPAGVAISYRARIGGGLAIYHPSLGIVVSPHTEAGRSLVLTGGNCIGVRHVLSPGERLVLGDRVVLGANAVVLGPIRLGDDVWVGAGTVVTRDAPDRAVVRGASATFTVKPVGWRPSPENAR